LGTAEEAAEWVNYCNNPNNSLRHKHNVPEPYGVKYWQIGNETSYCTTGYNTVQCVDATRRFADAMRRVDPSINLIGWGDNYRDDKSWCAAMSRVDEVDMIAFHHHFGSGLPQSPLKGTSYRDNYEYTWLHLMNAYRSMEDHIAEMRADCGNKRLAMTEGHYAIPGRNRNEVLSSWGAGVSYARCHNVIMRNSDILDIATMADFFGTAWQVNALIIPNNNPQSPEPGITPKPPYLQPVGSVMSLFGHHQGKHALDLTHNGSIDAVASKTGNTIYLHIANTDMNASQTLSLDFGGHEVRAARMYVISAKPDVEITYENPNCFDPKDMAVDARAILLPAAAVAAIEVELV